MDFRGAVRWVRRTLEPRPRLVDWSILALVVLQLLSGLVSLVTGSEGGWWVFWAHSVAGLTLTFLLVFKLYRVRRRVTDSRLWTRSTALSVLLAIVALSALGTGIAWVLGGDVDVLYWGLMNVHILFGLLLLPLVLLHMTTRFRRPRTADFEGRRTAVQYTALLVGGAVLFRLQETVNAALDTAGTTRRFTGSKPVEGSDFPVTSWVADDPDPVDRETWRLRVGGLVETPLELTAGDVDTGDTGDVGDGRDELRALLDCTSGWYTVQDWQGVRVGDLLDRAGASDEGRWVRFTSVTGYRWSLPLEEARDALLATHVGGERLSHGHGAPLRLVAPDRRGFQWVKWVESVEVRENQDVGQWLAVMVSGFD
ncbi:Oxidoreductase molybdopterin binding domain-containing protein [Halogranum gelatinilyticum]|uniref:Oxidoreductase molybdopterin binding domain-containing protein n=1 Tax=Halogranum gelatinilyticum TaxID=660521 RepID=A0A1G9QBN1_9EURY|nr:molybdopterin-dependent oxidoreductase [Halogranum gelatinilyticum]SDM08482.1 Oxidoreductase molybdopterin binding domain-containing protein [Halogranum gelatinilyticum]